MDDCVKEEVMRSSTRSEAIQREIVGPIEASGVVDDAWEEFDVESIAEEVLGDFASGYVPTVDVETFWQVVESNANK